MTLVVFSDIHGNIYSLEKALREMLKYNPDQYLFLGDMAGYYYYQNECIELLMELPNLISLKGNHDDNFLKAMDNKVLLEQLTYKYGKSYEILKENITSKSLKYLQSMQIFEQNNIYEAYHGSPNNYLNEYIYPDNESFKLDSVSTPFLFMGHTHYLMEKNIQDTLVINPGSIGQPRDYNKPSFAVIETVSKDTELVRYDYNKEVLKEDILLLNDDNYLTKILNRTKNEI
jgi:putative phosphoesterase